MSHVAGIGPALARSMGLPDAVPPHILCDGCGVTHPVTTTGGVPAEWEVQGNPPPRWTGARLYAEVGMEEVAVQEAGVKREDYCPACSFARL